MQYLRQQRRYSEHTVTSYLNDLVQFSNYLKEAYETDDLTAVTHFHVRSWLVSLVEQGITSRSINRKISTLKSFYKYLMRQGGVDKTPMAKIEPPKVSKRLPTFIDKQQIANLLGQVHFGDGLKGLRDRLIVEILYSTGMRRAELLNLKQADIDLPRMQLKVLGKGNKERLIPIGQPLADTITTYIKELQQHFDTPWLLVTDKGRQLYPEYVYAVVKKFLTLVTTVDKKSPHVLRHTFATHLSNNGADLNAIKDLLGHSSLAATQVYTHNNLEILKEVYKKSHPKA